MENRTYSFFKGEPCYAFGHGLTYSKIEEEWQNSHTVWVHNRGEYDTDYTVLRFAYVPHKSLCDFKCVHLRAGESVMVSFDA